MRGYRPPTQRPDPVGPPVAVPGRLYGVRKWNLRGDYAGQPRLLGLGGGHWRPGGETTWAECDLTMRRSHPVDLRAPVGACSCGLYGIHPWMAVASRFGIEPRHWGFPQAVGIIEGWGRVQLHAEGFRAQYARPVILTALGFDHDSDLWELIGRLALAYRAHAIELADAPALIEYCAEAGLGMTRSAVRGLIGERDTGPVRVDGRVHRSGRQIDEGGRD